MAAWETFEYDEATDWVDGFATDGPPAIRSALDAVLESDPGSYLEATEAAQALAAAEMVAAAIDGDTSRLPEEATSALEEHRSAIVTGKFGRDALRAVQRIMKRSELKEQAEESDSVEEWQESLDNLAERLRT